MLEEVEKMQRSGLYEYRKKRAFDQTSEPKGLVRKKKLI
jgi:hypothetical protein